MNDCKGEWINDCPWPTCDCAKKINVNETIKTMGNFFEKNGDEYNIWITPETPSSLYKLEKLIHTHSEYETEFDHFLNDELKEIFKKYNPPKQDEIRFYQPFYDFVERFVGNTKVIYCIKIITSDVMTDELEKEFKAALNNYFKDFYIKNL